MILATINRPVVIRQSVKAGSNFGGLAPIDGATPLSPTLENDIFTFAPGTNAGLFNPQASYYAFERKVMLELVGIMLTMGSQDTWTFSLVDSDANSVTVQSGTTEASYFRPATEPIIIPFTSTLKLVTVGADAAMTASVILRPCK